MNLANLLSEYTVNAGTILNRMGAKRWTGKIGVKGPNAIPLYIRERA